jgi:hypothetical protein
VPRRIKAHVGRDLEVRVGFLRAAIGQPARPKALISMVSSQPAPQARLLNHNKQSVQKPGLQRLAARLLSNSNWEGVDGGTGQQVIFESYGHQYATFIASSAVMCLNLAGWAFRTADGATMAKQSLSEFAPCEQVLPAATLVPRYARTSLFGTLVVEGGRPP